ncbi:coagulation factor XIII B chain-like [Hyperolius riggenbachi]|uniref:coagulation factor XIII B chain-like n=1 Tax=Hyperolius riggenbachi TaxID=752182 RepID=UPI0035A294CF
MKRNNFLLLAVAYSIFRPAEGTLCDLPNVENGKIAQYFYTFTKFYFPMKEGKTLSMVCSAGYTFHSGKQEEQITCTPEGWQPSPVCYKKCTQPSLINGIVHNVKETYKTLETAQYKCFDGYTTKTGHQAEETQCSSGSWTPPPECHQISDRCEAPPLENGIYTSRKTSFRNKETIQFQCNKGYYTASGSTANSAECLPSGWSSIPQCIKSSCVKLEPVENGGFYPVKASYADRDVVQFFCKENYSLKGAELIQCYSYGWDPEPPTCEVTELKEKIKCSEPHPVDNGEVVMTQDVYYSGDTVLYRCAEGYEIQGLSKSTCKRGKWTEPPTCNINNENCRSPPQISHGELSDAPLDSYIVGSSVEYRCHSYHFMDGSKTVYCARGNWSQPPKCLQPCTVSMTHMKERNMELQWAFEINSKFLHGDMVEFKCKDGFDMSPHSELKGLCQNGEILYPSCSIKDTLKSCGPPPVVTHGTVNTLQQVHTSGSFVIYQCSEYYYLNGHNKVHCTDGQWGVPPTCIEPCILSKEEMDKSHLQPKWHFSSNYILHGEIVEFLCKAGYENYETTVMFALRSLCRFGKLTYPKCVKRS